MLPDWIRISVTVALVALSAVAGAAEPTHDLRTTISSLPRDEKDRLRNNQERFEKLPAAEQMRLRELDHAIQTHPRRDELLEVLNRYYAWVRTLRPSELDELRTLQAKDPKQWLAKVDEWRRRDRLNGVSPLSRDDYEQLRAWWDEIAANHFKRLKTRDAEVRSDGGSPPGEHADRARERRRAPPGPWMIFEDADNEDFDRLKNQLSDEHARVLGEQTTKREKVELVIRWFFQPLKRPDRSELERFFANELDPVVREQLLRLDRGDMEEQLRQRYNFAYGKDFPDGGPSFRPGPPPGPRDDDGPRR
jgi:hypothetical protein